MKLNLHKTLQYTLLLMFMVFAESWGQSVTALPQTITQNFDNYRGSSGTLPSGWSMSGGSYKGIATATTNSIGYYAFASGADHNLASIRSGSSGNVSSTVTFTNNSGVTITELTFSWNYEQWRFQNATGYSIAGTDALAGNATISTKSFVGTSSGSGLAQTAVPTFTLSGLNIANGASYGITWTTNDATGADNGIAIDDFTMTANGAPPAILTVSATSLPAFADTNLGATTASKTFDVSGANLTGNIVIDAPSTDFQVSINNTTWGPSATILTPGNSTYPVYVRFSPQSVGAKSDLVQITSGTAPAKTVAVSGTGISTSPYFESSTLAPLGSVCINTTTTAESFELYGYNLTSSITVGPLLGYQFSETLSGTYANTITLAPSSGEIAADIYVKLTPTIVQSYDGNIPVSGGGFTGSYNVAVTGAGINTPVSIITGSAATIASTSASLSASYVAGCSAVTAYGIEYSTVNNFANGSGTTLAGTNATSGNFSVAISGLAPNTNYYFKGYATDATGTVYGTQESFITLGLVSPIAEPATNLESQSFLANWQAVSGATNYRLDVATTATFAQSNTLLTEDFEDGNLNGWNNTGSWVNSTSVPLSGSNSLRLNATGAMTTYIVTQPDSYDVTAGTTTWRFNVRPAYAPSSNNKFYFYLTGDQSTLTSANGYVVGVNFVGTDDLIKLWKSTSGTGSATPMITSSQEALQNTTYGIEVSRTKEGVWILKTKANGGFTEMTIAGTTTDTSYLFSTYSGLVSATSSSNSQNLKFDDFSIVNEINTILPNYNDLQVNGTSQLVSGLNANTNYYYRVRATSSNSTSPNSNVITVSTVAGATFSAIQQSEALCGAGNATFNVLGLVANQSTTLVYNIDNGTNQTVAIDANSNGIGSFELPLAATDNGLVLTVTSAYITGSPSQALSITENHTVILNVPTAILYYADTDGDGFGDPNDSVSSCTGAPVGYITDSSDCFPTILTYLDGDNDGFGSTTLAPCGVTNNTDCDDTDSNKRGLFSFYADDDFDGFGAGNLVAGICALDAATPPAGYSLTNDDCSAGNSSINPGATEILYNRVDENCNGLLDEGFEVKTKIQPSQCGATLSKLYTSVAATQIAGATGYIFHIRKLPVDPAFTPITDPAAQHVVTNNHYFAMSTVTGIEYGTDYEVSVEVRMSGNSVFVGYVGEPCRIGTPPVLAPNVAGGSSQCNTTLPNFYSTVGTTPVNSAVAYKFFIRDIAPAGTGGLPVNYVGESIERSTAWFTLSMFQNVGYGRTYELQVAVKTSANGNYSPYSPVCVITTPPAQPLVNCEASIPTKYTNIATTNLSRVTQYEFELTNIGSAEPDPITTSTILTSKNYFNFNQLPAANYYAGIEYGVRVRVYVNNIVSEWTDPCVIISPAAAGRQSQDNVLAGQGFNAIALPNPFANSFAISVSTSSIEAVSYKVYDMTGRLLEARTAAVSEMASQEIGDRYPAGVYNVIVSQGTEIKTLRVIKR